MVPIALLGTAIFQGLRLYQGKLSHERYLDEAIAKVAELEREVEILRARSESQVADTALLASPHGKANKRGWFW